MAYKCICPDGPVFGAVLAGAVARASSKGVAAAGAGASRRKTRKDGFDGGDLETGTPLGSVVGRRL